MKGRLRVTLVLAAVCAAACDNGNGGGAADLAMTPPADLAMASKPDLAGSLGDGGAPGDGFLCSANAFLQCNGQNAVYCDGSGSGVTSFDCNGNGGSGGCKGPSGCGQCSADRCMAGTLTTCDTAHQKTNMPAACVTLGAPVGMCADATNCTQCSGANVCGDGVHYGSTSGTSYACSGGKLVMTGAVACAFGCDGANGKCRDFVPANQAAAHLDQSGTADHFTCTGTQSATLPAVTAGAGDTLTFDTGTAGAPTITKSNGANSSMYNARWGAAYKPTGSGTNAMVAHIASLDVKAGATVNVVGPSALILLVDHDVSLAGDAAAVTLVKLNATKYTAAGPGAPSTTLGGGGGAAPGSTASLGYGGGGGAAHGSAGGKGGGGNSNPNTGGAAGAAYGGNGPVLEAGTSGGSGDDAAALGGRGGGALQVSACGNLAVGAHVVLNASGGGGKGGALPNGMNPGHGGGGGGSGGTLVLEAATMNGGGGASLDGALAANGGSGGGGAGASNGLSGDDGSDWSPATPVSTAPTGGKSGATGGAAGGPGGTVSTSALDGVDAIASYGGGGGGGAVGRIFVNVGGGATPAIAAASPAPKLSHACATNNGAAPVVCLYP